VTRDELLRTILTKAQTIAVVGHSNKPDRTSYQIAQFLRQMGYRVYPVNPTVVTIDDQPCYPSLRELPESVDIVNVFRRSEVLPEVVNEVIQAGISQTIWAQLGVAHPEAARQAEAAGVTLVMDTCIKTEYQRVVQSFS
jgi:hypothetical protein